MSTWRRWRSSVQQLSIAIQPLIATQSGSNLYLTVQGSKEKRLTGEEHMEVVEEFCAAAQHCFPNCLIQFEDFQTNQAFAILEKMRNKYLCFNDDIQGTGGVVTAGYVSTLQPV